MISRREFLQLSASLGMLTAVGKLDLAHAAPLQDYKALVCVFMFGGNDGLNMVVPLDSAQYAAYRSARGGLALSATQLLPITDPTLGAFGLNNALPELQALFNQGNLAILANVGVLVAPTSYAHLLDRTAPLPTNLRSHGRQVVSMQTGYATAGGTTGWGGRTLDCLEAHNANTDFPVAIAMERPAVYCAGTATRGISLQPGNDLEQQAFKLSPVAAAQARLTAQQQIIAADSGNAIIDAANDVMVNAHEEMAIAGAVKAILGSGGSGSGFPKPFPSGTLGSQLQDIAGIISLNAQYGVGRQVFFCSLGGFDTHFGQLSDQSTLLKQVSKALDAFYAALTSLGLDRQVTTFTLSDFGRTFQPSGTGTDHGWGNHHLILGGAVGGGKIYGRFPLMTNYSNFNASADDFSDGRGVMLPSVSLAQYGGTLAKWFGATEAQMDSIFPELANFDTRDLGFLA